MLNSNELSTAQNMLDCIPCSHLDRNEWIKVGMALKYEDFPYSMFDTWSATDPTRYSERECRRAWNSFDPKQITGGSLYYIANMYGYRGRSAHSETINKPKVKQVETAVAGLPEINVAALPEPPAQQVVPVQAEDQTRRYIEALFCPGDFINIVTACVTDEKRPGKFNPTGKGSIIAFESFTDIPAYNKDAGAWIRCNPVQKEIQREGVSNADITAYRHALVESDELDIDQQLEIMNRLQLPCAAQVFSGGKSIHAIVKVDAKTEQEYAERVQELFDICDSAGLKVDRKCKNPSRLTRIPGVQRGDLNQELISVNTGKTSWDEWKQFILLQKQLQETGLPEIESFFDVLDNIPERKPVLIDGVLRKTHVMEISGASKIGKSFLQIELAIAVAAGGIWLEHRCSEQKVLYCNLEIDPASMKHRVLDVMQELKVERSCMNNLHLWNLRGCQLTISKFSEQLLLRCKSGEYGVVIIDPIYKLFEGDENSAGDVSKMFNAFDHICSEIGCALVFCHHHSKGGQGGKNSMDRSSGSGVFARSPDAIVDVLELKITDEIRENAAACGVDLTENSVACEYGFTLREFPPVPKQTGFFNYPLHVPDEFNLLNNAPSARDAIAVDNAKKLKQGNRVSWQKILDESFTACCGDQNHGVVFSEFVQYIGKNEKTIINNLGVNGYKRRDGLVYKSETLERIDREKAHPDIPEVTESFPTSL